MKKMSAILCFHQHLELRNQGSWGTWEDTKLTETNQLKKLTPEKNISFAEAELMFQD